LHKNKMHSAFCIFNHKIAWPIIFSPLSLDSTHNYMIWQLRLKIFQSVMLMLAIPIVIGLSQF
jgi:hypothetical protein